MTDWPMWHRQTDKQGWLKLWRKVRNIAADPNCYPWEPNCDSSFVFGKAQLHNGIESMPPLNAFMSVDISRLEPSVA
jgi:hypothetical protein